MTPKEKSEDLVHKFRMLLMNEDTDCGEEILVSIISKKCALIAVDEMMQVYASALHAIGMHKDIAELIQSSYLQQVKQEIEKL